MFVTSFIGLREGRVEKNSPIVYDVRDLIWGRQAFDCGRGASVGKNVLEKKPKKLEPRG